MQVPQLGMKPLADHDPVPNNDGPDKRIRADPPPPALRQLKRPQEVLAIRNCKRSIHVD